jgi:hypothetical protein
MRSAFGVIKQYRSGFPRGLSLGGSQRTPPVFGRVVLLFFDLCWFARALDAAIDLGKMVSSAALLAITRNTNYEFFNLIVSAPPDPLA